MPWEKIKVVDQRKKFIEAWVRNTNSLAALCRQFNISRPTAYKWIYRFENGGIEALEDLSRAPHKQANASTPQIVAEIVRVKEMFPLWGPKKIKAHLEREKPFTSYPSVTTMWNILNKYGLTSKRRLRRRLAKRNDALVKSNESNDVWCLDFKGWFHTKNQRKCEPFTVSDSFSRYLIVCTQLQRNDTDCVWSVLERAFYDYGLPKYLQSDNGPPFASTGPGRLSKLSIKLIKAGVQSQWIEPGKPYQNGKHERMHLTLKQEGAMPGKLLWDEQIDQLDKFIEYYNFVRPHEALKQKRPGDIYVPSSRVWTGRLRAPEYSSEHKIGRVRSCGKLYWRGDEIYIGTALSNEYVGLVEKEAGWHLFFGPVFLGVLDDREKKFFYERNRSRREKTSKKSVENIASLKGKTK